MRKEFAPETMSKLFISLLKRSLLYEERIGSRNCVRIALLLSDKEFTLGGKSLLQKLCQNCFPPF